MTAKAFAIVDAIELENISGGGFPWLPIPDLIRLAGHFWNHYSQGFKNGVHDWE